MLRKLTCNVLILYMKLFDGRNLDRRNFVPRPGVNHRGLVVLPLSVRRHVIRNLLKVDIQS